MMAGGSRVRAGGIADAFQATPREAGGRDRTGSPVAGRAGLGPVGPPRGLDTRGWVYYRAGLPISAPKDLIACRQFFLESTDPKQRQYEALRAYFVEGRSSQEVARAFGYSVGSFRVLCHHFRRDTQLEFFATPRHGPQTQPQKTAARDTIIALRKQNYSVYEIIETVS